MVSAQARLEQARYAVQRGLSQRRACALMRTARSGLYYDLRMPVKDAPVIEAMKDLSGQFPRFGARRINIFLSRQGIAWLSAVLYIHHHFGTTTFAWQEIEYVGAKSGTMIVAQFADSNSRVYQASSDRSVEPNPSRLLILNTWLDQVTASGPFLAKGYESMQPAENTHYYEASPTDAASLKKLGVSLVWANSSEFQPSDFDSGAFVLKYRDDQNFLLQLKDPGQIVSCKSQCNPTLYFYADNIEVNFPRPTNEVIKVKINPLPNMSVWSDGQRIESVITKDGWLAFTANGNASFQIRYQDTPFLALLLFANAVFIGLLVGTMRQRHSNLIQPV